MRATPLALTVVIPLTAILVLLPSSPNPAPAAPATPNEETDLAQIQGLWERKTGEDIPGLRRATKEIRGNHETITYYGGPNATDLLAAHEVDIKVSRRDGIRIFTFSNWVGTEGSEKGRTSPAPVSYIYRADENTFVEVWGFVPGQEQRPPLVMMWVKKLPQQSADAAAADQHALQGRWLTASATAGAGPAAGEAAPAAAVNTPPDFPGEQITFHDDDFTVRTGGHTQLSGVIRLNPAASPKAIDLIITQSPNGLKTGQVIRGIYELADNGRTLKWCNSPRNQTRPKGFTLREGGTQTLAELRREDAKR